LRRLIRLLEFSVGDIHSTQSEQHLEKLRQSAVLRACYAG
jgi:hypothetical protein